MKNKLHVALLACGITSFGLVASASSAAATYYKNAGNVNIGVKISLPPSSTSSSQSTIKRYYFVDQSWWNADAAQSYIYIWKSSSGSAPVKYPGQAMKWVKYDSTKKQNLWYFDIDTKLYDRALIGRYNTNTTGMTSDNYKNYYWGAKTVDITLDMNKNTMTLQTSAAWIDKYDSGTKANVTWSTVAY